MPVTNYIWDEDNLLAEADGSDAVETVYTNEPEQYGRGATGNPRYPASVVMRPSRLR
jgi:hypothetical protein